MSTLGDDPTGTRLGDRGGGERDRVQTRTVAVGGNRRMPSGETRIRQTGKPIRSHVINLGTALRFMQF